MYINQLNQEYLDILNGENKPSEKFWQLDARINNDKKSPGIELEMKRSHLIKNILTLLEEDVISNKDLEKFSHELQTTITQFQAIN